MGVAKANQACFGVLLAVALVGPGCTSLQSTQLPLDELRHGIRNESLVQPGDRVSVVDSEGKEYIFVVRKVDEDAIRGEQAAGDEVTVAIDEVLALRTGQTHGVRTTFAVLGGIGGGALGTLLLLYVLSSGA